MENEDDTIWANQGWPDERMIEFIRERPYITASMLIVLGYDVDDLRKYAKDILKLSRI